MRDLNLGGPQGPSAYFAYHSVYEMPGYSTAFGILDDAIQQLSENTVRVGQDDSKKIVDAVERIPA